jgi:DNA-binding transcriptional ArsR family regulator
MALRLRPPWKSTFAIVAQPNGRAILSLLLSSERSVGEIERELRLSQPSVSRHLRVLREAGFVDSSRAAAQKCMYQLRPPPSRNVRFGRGRGRSGFRSRRANSQWKWGRREGVSA